MRKLFQIVDPIEPGFLFHLRRPKDECRDMDDLCDGAP